MSESDEIEVLVEGTGSGGEDWAGILRRGEEMDFAGTDTTVNYIEVRPAGDDDLETDGGEIPEHYWVECRKCGHRTVAFERYCRHCSFDRQGHRVPERRADGGTETIDESQTVREAAQPLVTMLRGCKWTSRCNRLAEVAAGDATVDALDYEDLFYPMRCHRDDGLVLYVDAGAMDNWLQYGAGDLFYWMTDDERTMESAVDPFDLWDAISPGSVEVEPVLVEDTPFGEDR